MIAVTRGVMAASVVECVGGRYAARRVQPTVLHILPHRGGGAEGYLDALARCRSTQRRMALSSSRSPLAAGAVDRRALARGRAGGSAAPTSCTCTATWRRSCRCRSCAARAGRPHDPRPALPAPRARACAAPRRAAALRAAVAASRRTICTSEAERDELGAFLPAALRAAPRRDPQHGAARRAPRARSRRARGRELGLATDRVVALFLGAARGAQGSADGGAAAQRGGGAAGAPLVLLVAGGGPLLEDRARALAGPAVRVLGHRDDPRTLLAAADLLVMPSRREGQSIAVLEAMRDGLRRRRLRRRPATPSWSAMRAIVVPAGDAAALAAALARLAADADERRRLGAAARRRYEEHFSPERFQARDGARSTASCSARLGGSWRAPARASCSSDRRCALRANHARVLARSGVRRRRTRDDRRREVGRRRPIAAMHAVDALLDRARRRRCRARARRCSACRTPPPRRRPCRSPRAARAAACTRARRSASWTSLGVDEPRARRRAAALPRSAAIARSTAPRSGPSPKMTPRRPGIRSAASATAADDARGALLRDQPAGEDHERLAARAAPRARASRRTRPRAPSPRRAGPPRAAARRAAARSRTRAGAARAQRRCTAMPIQPARPRYSRQ